MKIGRQQIDPLLLNKIDQLDTVISEYVNGDDYFINYGKDGFHLKKVNQYIETPIKKIISENEIAAMKSALVNPLVNTKSTYAEDIAETDTIHISTRNFLHNISQVKVKSFKNKIILTKEINGVLYFLDKLSNITNEKESISVNFLEALENSISLSQPFGVWSIVDIDAIDDDTLLISTDNFGIYTLTVSNRNVERILSISDVVSCKKTDTNTLFVATKNGCFFYTIDTHVKIESYNNVSKSFQIPIEVIKHKRQIILIGQNTSPTSFNTVLHIWELDDDGLSYILKDSFIERYSWTNQEKILGHFLTDNHIWIYGEKQNKTFILSYNLQDYHLEILEFNIRPVSINKVGRFFAIKDTENILNLFSEEGKSLLRIQTEDFLDILVKDGHLLVINDFSLNELPIPSVSNKTESLIFNIYNKQTASNNIDILVLNGADKNITLINGENNNDISPSYKIKVDNDLYMKLSNFTMKNIKMRISVNSNDYIDGIICQDNRIYF